MQLLRHLNISSVWRIIIPASDLWLLARLVLGFVEQNVEEYYMSLLLFSLVTLKTC